MPFLEIKGLVKRYGAVAAVDGVDLAVERGEFLSLLGPSGCGKSTTLLAIAGFIEPSAGSIRIDGREMAQVKPNKRNIGIVFQSFALFPHMTVAENVGYGLRFRDMSAREASKRVEEMLSLVKLSGFGSRRPFQLSGGEQQRVALARALAINPTLVLLDEPLSALDAKLRQELRIEIKEILARVGATTIIVTHDQEEALGIAERVIVMNRGVIEQEGSPTEIYLRPDNRFVAEFIGRSNMLEGTIIQHDLGRARFSGSGVELIVPSDRMSMGTLWACIRPERIAVFDASAVTAQQQTYDNVLSGTVVDSAPLAADIHLLVQLASQQRIAIVEKNLGQPGRTRGASVLLCFNAEDCLVVTS